MAASAPCQTTTVVFVLSYSHVSYTAIHIFPLSGNVFSGLVASFLKLWSYLLGTASLHSNIDSRDKIAGHTTQLM